MPKYGDSIGMAFIFKDEDGYFLYARTWEYFDKSGKPANPPERVAKRLNNTSSQGGLWHEEDHLVLHYGMAEEEMKLAWDKLIKFSGNIGTGESL